jgi:hypothetical protein
MQCSDANSTHLRCDVRRQKEKSTRSLESHTMLGDHVQLQHCKCSHALQRAHLRCGAMQCNAWMRNGAKRHEGTRQMTATHNRWMPAPYNRCNANARMRYNARTFDALRCNAMPGCATMRRDTKALVGCPPRIIAGCPPRTIAAMQMLACATTHALQRTHRPKEKSTGFKFPRRRRKIFQIFRNSQLH